MYLLILMFIDVIHILINYLHPTMYLLIPQHRHQYRNHCQNLHPTMYLLILLQTAITSINNLIYIPLCIY